MSTFASRLEEALARIRARSEYRTLRPAVPVSGGKLVRDGRSFLDFSSNDYLGLSQHPLLRQRASEWAELHGAGSGASRLVSGTSPLHVAVERKIAAFKGAEAALVFASGWQLNAAVLPALLNAAPDALVFTDRLIHASLHHGCAAAAVHEIRFRHNDLAHLEALLAQHSGKAGPRLIVTESVFSMDGDRADLDRLAALARRHDAFLYVDEAHATGVLGTGGAGLASNLPGAFDLVMGTFSKALGGFGAYVAGSQSLCDYLVNSCSSFIFSTALPPAVLGAIDAALDLVPTMETERARLAGHGEKVRAALRAGGFDVGLSTTQIVPVILGDAEMTLAASRRLEEAGILASAIRPPTVARGSSRLRLALRATHSDSDVEHLIATLCRELAPVA